MEQTLRADARAVRVWDGFVVFWVTLWMVLGVWTGVTLWQASDTGDTITTSGDALATVGGALESLAEIPVVGEGPGEIGREVSATASDISERGQEVKAELRRLSLLLGVSIVALPLMPVLGFYLPLRLAWRRRQREVRRALETHADDEALDAYLAGRARSSFSWSELHEIRTAATGDGGRGEDRALADAELARLGLTRP